MCHSSPCRERARSRPRAGPDRDAHSSPRRLLVKVHRRGRPRPRRVARVVPPDRPARSSRACRASADAGDADDEALPWKPTSILADLTSGDGPTETERRPNRASSDETRVRPRRGPAKTFAATAVGGAALFAAASMLPAGVSPASPRPANASSSATASSSTLVGSVTAESVKSKTSGFPSTFATYKEYSAGEIFAYEAQKVFALPLLGKVACLFVLTIPIVFLGGLGYKLVDVLDGESGDDESFREKLKSAYFNLFDIPGADATTDEDWRSGVDAGDRVRGHVRVRGDHRHHLRRDRHEGGGGEDGNNKVIEKITPLS